MLLVGVEDRRADAVEMRSDRDVTGERGLGSPALLCRQSDDLHIGNPDGGVSMYLCIGGNRNTDTPKLIFGSVVTRRLRKVHAVYWGEAIRKVRASKRGATDQ